LNRVQDLFIEFWNKRVSIGITSSLGSYFVSSLYYKSFYYLRIKVLQDKHIRDFQEFLQQSDQGEYDAVSVLLHEAEVVYLTLLT
jgi:hypothetical protein